MRNARRFVTAAVVAGVAVVLSIGPVHADVIWTRPQPTVQHDRALDEAVDADRTTVAGAMLMTDVIWT